MPVTAIDWVAPAIFSALSVRITSSFRVATDWGVKLTGKSHCAAGRPLLGHQTSNAEDEDCMTDDDAAPAGLTFFEANANETKINLTPDVRST